MRKGFTLVEILIVIVVLGILTSMMTISMSASKISADASNIVTRLRNAKTAAMAMYVQYLDTWEGNVNDAQKSFDMAEVRKFLNNDKNYDNNYVLVRGGSTNNIGDYAKVKWYVAYNLGDDNARLAEKLAGRAEYDDLFGNENVLNNDNTYNDGLPNNKKTFLSNHKAVLLRVK